MNTWKILETHDSSQILADAASPAPILPDAAINGAPSAPSHRVMVPSRIDTRSGIGLTDAHD
ncbi:hypothetical protein [Agromyces bauzanensis]|uniref:Uncharacterized protein n=1 Tax=Agromyces bauzanensis TaxID=1308924 RepID=A0A917UTW5_9MICO|nr:hypothetical protein [Agromyces bauzanensis]GGJ85598.1 hypothetical protein GCM10011372_24880 [Agromyces bauzanensis]